jgi:hypothetical protein
MAKNGKKGSREASLAGVRLKLKRAGEQLQALDSEMAVFRQGQPYKIVRQINPDTLEMYGVFRVIKEMEPMWSVQIGEIVHNMRSALDHFVFQVVIAETGVASKAKKLQFPIFETPEGYRDRGKKMLGGVSSSAKAFIKSLQPFVTGEGQRSPLWHLKELSDLDKHRDVTVAAAAAKAISVEAVYGEVIELRVSPTHQPLENDTVVCSVVFRPSDVPLVERAEKVKMDPNLTYYITVKEPPVALEKPVITMLDDIGRRINDLLVEGTKRFFS